MVRGSFPSPPPRVFRDWSKLTMEGNEVEVCGGEVVGEFLMRMIRRSRAAGTSNRRRKFLLADSISNLPIKD